MNNDALYSMDTCPEMAAPELARGANLRSASDYRVLMSFLVEGVPSLLVGERENLTKIVASLIPQRKRNLTVLGAIEIPEEASLSTGALPARNYRRFLESFGQFAKTQGVEMDGLVKVSRCAGDTIFATAREENCDLLLVSCPGGLEKDSFYGISIDEVIEKSPINTVVVKPGRRRGIRRILIPLWNMAYAKHTINIALAIAGKLECDITVMHVLDGDVSSEEIVNKNLSLASCLAELGLREGDYRLVSGCSGNSADSVGSVAGEYDLIIMGSPFEVSYGKSQIDPSIKSVVGAMDATVLIVKPAPSLKPGEVSGVAEQGARIIRASDVVDKWFAENSFHAGEFADIKKLVGLKQKQGLKISLGLPTLNEEETIGNIINTIKNELYDKYPLVDEIVVIDSSSTDSTVEIAKSYGVEVYDEDEILPAWGTKSGKGGALWKSLYVLKGDIIIWIDTDIKNIHPRFVYGLVGPLIKYPSIKYVKGFYRRPVKIDDHFFETGGGRVTELTARPLINLFFPELSGLIQPLSGEYAGRREVLEQVGFYSGYGVEIGLLIDILEKFGLDAIGQVDLIERIHRNQPLTSLSKMSSAIIQVVIDRLEQRQKVKLLGEINKTIKLIKHEPNLFSLELNTIEEIMRPPMITLPEYRKLFSSPLIDIASELI